MSEENGASNLERNNEKNDIFRQGLFTHQLRHLPIVK